MASHVGICQSLCKVQGSVKYTSLESGQTSWKTGNLELATTATGQVVCLVNFKIGPSKTFVLTNQIKGVIFNHQVPRCVINLTTGTNINWTVKGHDTKRINSFGEVTRFSKFLEDLKNGPKKDGRPNTTAQLGLHMSPVCQAYTPVKQTIGPRNSQSNQPQNTTPRSRLSMTTLQAPVSFMSQKYVSPKATSGRNSPNPMMTPSHLKAALGHAVSEPININEIKDDSGTGSDEAGRTELSPVLFTDLQSDGEKENGGGETYSIPKLSNSVRSKSVFEMRKEEGGSLFMSSFQEKQLQLEARKENTAPRQSSGVKSFYSRVRQTAGYAASDALLQPRQTNSNMSCKRTPGFLSLSQPKRPCLSTNYAGWSQRNIPSSVKTSQISLQGFSNLGNTCYMNAILQSLFALERFTMDILNSDLSHMQKDSLYKALASLLFDKQRNQPADRIGMQLRRVKQAICSTAERFSGYMQHDAQEFLCQCLDQLKEDWEKAKQTALGAPPSDGSRTEGKADPKAPRHCPVVRNFEFEVTHSIVCKQCKEVITKAEQFYDLSLDMPGRSSSNPIGSIQTALEQFFRAEAIEYACSECDCKQATVTHTFTRLPRVIIIHLKRYRFDIDAVQNSKLQRRITIPKYLTLHHHCAKETQSATSGPRALINGASSPLRLLNGETIHRTSIIGSTDGNISGNSQSEKLSRFSFASSSRKRLEYNSSNTSNQPHQAILDRSSASDEDDTQQALTMSKREAQRAKEAQEKRQRQEEVELKKAMERSKQDADRSIAKMSEEQQLAYALAISAQDASMLHPHDHPEFLNQSATKGGDNPVAFQKLHNDADVLNFVEDDEDKEVFVSLKRRETDDISSSVDKIHLQGSGDSVEVESKENTTPSKRFKSDGQVSNHSTPSEHALCAGDSGIDLVDNARNLESGRTPSRPWRGVRKSIMNFFTPVKQTPNDSPVGLDNDQMDTPRLAQKPTLVEASSVDIHREQDHNTLEVGENDSEKPSYEELKAKEDEELRRATELSLQDAQEMAEKEEDALKRAKEISLQEFSESFNSLEEEDDAVEPMEIDDESDDDTRKELTKNAESGHLPSSYRLISVVSHIGSTSTVGHYISDVCDGKKSTWLSYDDSQVVRTSESAVREDRQRTGYIFFYVAK